MSKKKLVRAGSYLKTIEVLNASIVGILHLYLDAKNNGDKIAMWTLGDL